MDKNNETLLELRNIKLSYGKIKVLDNFHLKLQKGKIHAILGEHGAGKSSAAKIISGYSSPDNGKIIVNGKSFSCMSLTVAQKKKIKMVYQNSTLNHHFTVAENLFYAQKRVPFFSWKLNSVLIKEAVKLIKSYGFEISAKEKIKHLNLSDRTIIELLSNLIDRPKLLILDETLEKISGIDILKVISIIKTLRDSGTAILIITHKIDGIYDLADYITIVRNGKNFYSDKIKLTNKLQLIKMAYTQMVEVNYQQDQYHTFYQLIKYNEAILFNLPVNLIIIDNNRIIKLLNKFCCDNFNINQNDYIENHISSIFYKTSQSNLGMIIDGINEFTVKDYYQIELIINDSEGVFNLKIFPINDNGFIIGSILLLENITEYIFKQKKDFLSDKLACIGLLSASVAHEINNPLEIVSSYVQNIKFKFNNKELQYKMCQIEKEIEYISNIVSHLQNLSNKDQISDKEIEANEHIKQIINLLKPTLQKKKIKVLFEPENGICFITIHQNEFKQVMLNLFKNSIEAMPDGGHINIQTCQEFKKNANNFRIIFRDTGIGIPENVNLFSPFYSTKKEDNSGLGLSITHSIITKYNGTISLNNIKEAGCEVIITMPVE